MNIELFLNAAHDLLRLVRRGNLPDPDRISYWVEDEQLQIAWAQQGYAPVFDLSAFEGRYRERCGAQGAGGGA